MKKISAIGFNSGRAGDICMGIVLAKTFKSSYPNSKLILGIAEQYKDITPIFKSNKYIDDIHIWEKHDGWPSQNDISYMTDEKFDIIFNPMPIHSCADWYMKYHQIHELHLMHNLSPPKDLQIELEKCFDIEDYKKCIGIVGGGVTRGEEKSLSENKYLEIINLVEKLGFFPIQLGLDNEYQYCPLKQKGTFFDKIKFALGCKAVISVDTSWAWVLSGFSFPVLGLYSFSYYIGATKDHVKNWQPINKNAIYLSESNLNNINIAQIEEGLKNLL